VLKEERFNSPYFANSNFADSPPLLGLKGGKAATLLNISKVFKILLMTDDQNHGKIKAIVRVTLVCHYNDCLLQNMPWI
jgi:hypothetical protein